MHETAEPMQPEYELRAKLYTKLHAVMGDVAYIKRDAKNDFHRYSYASEAAIKSALHKAFVEHRIVFLLSVVDVQDRDAADTKSGKKQWITRAVVEYEFTDIDTGYSVAKLFAGQGIDGEDKGLYKSVTGAIKYVLTSAFLIETGDDPESETDQGQRVKAAQRRSIEKVSKGIGTDDKGAFDVSKMIAALQAEKVRLIEMLGDEAGDARYRSVLRKHGVEKSNDKKLMASRERAAALWQDLKIAVIEAADELPNDLTGDKF